MNRAGGTNPSNAGPTGAGAARAVHALLVLGACLTIGSLSLTMMRGSLMPATNVVVPMAFVAGVFLLGLGVAAVATTLALRPTIERYRAALVAAEEAHESYRRERDESLDHLLHEVRTPLTSLVGFGHLLRRQDVTLPPAVIDQGLELVARNARRLNRILGGLVEVQGPTADVSPDGSADLSSVTRRVVEDLAIEGRTVTVDVGEVHAAVDEGVVERAFDSMLRSAVALSGASHAIRIGLERGIGRIDMQVEVLGAPAHDVVEQSDRRLARARASLDAVGGEITVVTSRSCAVYRLSIAVGGGAEALSA